MTDTERPPTDQDRPDGIAGPPTTGGPLTSLALAELVGGALDGEGLSVESVTHRGAEPTGSGVLYGFDVRTIGRDGERGELLVYADTSELRGDTAGNGTATTTTGGTRPAVFTSTSGHSVRLWTYPDDPELPALAPATVPGAAATLLARLGLAMPDAHMQVVTYRPGKRAVVRVTAGEKRVYLKVTRPGRVEGIRERHRALAAAGVPVPRVLASSPSGLLVLESIPGPTALESLTAGQADPAALFRSVLRLMESVAASGITLESRPGPLSRVSWYCSALRGAMPEATSRLAELEGRILSPSRSAPSVPGPGISGPGISGLRIPVHGDLHLGQLIVDPHDASRITGLLDVDTCGLGDPVEDAAAVAAHLITTALMRDDPTLIAVAEDWLALWAARDTPAAPPLGRGSGNGIPGPGTPAPLSAALAAHLVAHAAGPAQNGDRALAWALIGRAESALGDTAPPGSRR